uniref:G-protein coupled receptors family 1 profile domain-containing protein n=1 Tax=Sinocyclocheilus grahami TaxID=75366 RepID=A0A672T3K8_SINGR
NNKIDSKHKLHQCLIIYGLLQGSGTSHLKMSDHEDLNKLNPASVIVSVVFSLIFLLGTIGNSLVLAVLLRSGQVGYNTTNLFILNLSVADFFFIIFCVPFQATIYSLEGWVFGSFMCKVVHFFINLTMYASSFTLATVSVDRWVSSAIGFSFFLEKPS